MFTTAALVGIFEGAHLVDHEDEITHIVTDSRQISDGPRSLFFALRGKRTDGHKYLQSAWESGVRNFVVEKEPEEVLIESNVFGVPDAVRALQLLAIAHRKRFDIPCIGITGSNGKTWVKEWLFQLLSVDQHIVKSPRSYNSQIGVPLSVLRMRPHHTLAIFEAGISQMEEMAALAEVIRPEIGILTHFGDAHDAGFPGPQAKLREKCKLFEQSKTVMFAGDDPWLEEHMAAFLPGKQLLNWGHAASASMQVSTKLQKGGCRVDYRFNGKERGFHIPFRDAASIRNTITCALVMEHLAYSADEIESRMQLLHPIEMRLEIHQLPNRCILIDDSYSLDIASLQVGLETLAQHSAGMDRAIVISDIDHQRPQVYKDIGKLLGRKDLTSVYTIGDEIGRIKGLKAEHQHFPNVDTFLASRLWLGKSNTAYLLKGARRFGMERIVQHMQARMHSAILEIDLNAMLSNLQYFRSKLNTSTRIIAMVKAAAYGSGAAEIGKFLEFHNVDMLGVAYIDEGIELRRAGVRIPIIVMNPDVTAVDHMIEHQLEPEVFDLDTLRLLAEYVGTHDCEIRIHLKLDTGMHRLGFEARDITKLNTLLSNTDQRLEVASVFTHLAASTDPDERAFTLVQLNRFEAFYRSISSVLDYRPERHVLNTGGVMYYPEYQFEAVRLGIGLYGVGVASAQDMLEPVHAMKARISQVRSVDPGESIGYNRAFVADRPMRIATMNVGYADGLHRLAGNGRFDVQIGRSTAPIVGNVCMDMTMLDVTDLPSVAAGDEVIVFGPVGSLDKLASACQTIAYEILTGISSRIPRVFKFA